MIKLLRKGDSGDDYWLDGGRRGDYLISEAYLWFILVQVDFKCIAISIVYLPLRTVMLLTNSSF